MPRSELTPQARTPLTLLAVCLAACAMPLAFTGPAVALAAIALDLGHDPIGLNWTTNAFMLTFGGALMAAGALADAHGRKRVFLSGAGLYAVCAALLALAPNLLVFDLLRAAQGLGAAAALAGGMAALAQEIPQADRLRAFSLVGASFGAGLAGGPIVSGLVVVVLGWRGIFALGMICALAAVIIGARVMHESRDPEARGVDVVGAALFTTALTLLTWALLQGPQSGWGHPLVLTLLVGAAAALASFIRTELRVSRPMLDLSLFQYPRFVGVQLLATAPAYAFVVLLILLPVRLVGVEGMSALTAGRLMAALSAPLLVLPILAGWLSRWCSPSALCGGGLTVSAAGLVWLSRLPMDAVSWPLVGALATIGIGVSLPWGLMDGLAVSVVPKERAGMAAGIFSTTRVAGEGVALAIVVALLSSLIASRLPAMDGARAAAQRLATGDLPAAMRRLPGLGAPAIHRAYSEAFDLLLLLLAAVTLSTAVVVFIFLRRDRSAKSNRFELARRPGAS